MIKRNEKQNKKTLVVVILVIVLASGGAFLVSKRRQKPSENNIPLSTTSETIKYEEATNQEKTETEEFKNNQIEEQDQPSQQAQTGQKTAVSPVILSASISGDQAQLRSFVQGVVEDGGTCSYTFSKDSETIQKQVSGFANVSSTNCSPLDFPKSELTKGTWKVSLKYSSTKAEGVSGVMTLEVQ
jgi:hypothetical protein